MFVAQIIVSSGTRYLPGNVRAKLELLDQRGFKNVSFAFVPCEELILKGNAYPTCQFAG